MIKVQNNIPTRESIPAFLQGLASISLADLSWTDPALGVSDCKWLPEVDASPALQEYERYGDETLTIDGAQVIVTRAAEPWSAEEIAADQAEKASALQTSIVVATQERLDDFAKERGYDSILSACTYSTDPSPIFSAEGQTCVNARSETWSALYTVLAEVQAGTRAVPSGYDDIKADLPVLAWN